MSPPDGDTVSVECLSCNRVSEAEDQLAADHDGSWSCPYCRGEAALVIDPDNGGAP